MTSSDVVRIINVATTFNKLPSEVLHSDYADFCFDEACAYILNEMRQDKKPRWKDEKDKEEDKIENGLQYLMSLQRNL